MSVETYHCASTPSDMMSIIACIDLMRDTPYKPSRGEVGRWIRDYKMVTRRRGTTVQISFSDFLDAHALYVRAHQR
ncbi:hypothetical protein [Streptomyces sp. NPDC088348]|jgi:hypothetical protein|uniref:hypothetical protein n=1 Tax=Streptomyces sp. NPDC088348 TaxID=3365853 RepID=UPI00380C20D8